MKPKEELKIGPLYKIVNDDGINELNYGVSELNDNISKLTDVVSKLTDVVSKLNYGMNQLSNKNYEDTRNALIFLFVLSFVLAIYNVENYINLDRDLFKNDTKLDFNIYLTNKSDLDLNLNNSNQLIWMHKELDYIFRKEITTQTSTTVNKSIILNNYPNDNDIYLHIFVIKSNLSSSLTGHRFLHKIHQIKKNKKNSTSEFKIYLISHFEYENRNRSFNQLIDYNLTDNNYSPALFIEDQHHYNSSNNQLIINHNLTNQLNLKFNRIEFCQFIVYSCRKSSENDQLSKICLEESSKLSMPFIPFLSFIPALLDIIELWFDNNNDFRDISGLIVFYITWSLLMVFLGQNSRFESIKFKPLNLEYYSPNYQLFKLLKHSIFFIYYFQIFPYSNCVVHEKIKLLFYQLFYFIFIVFYFWYIIVLFSSIVRLFRDKIIENEINKSALKYDNLIFKYLLILMVPLLIGYSYYIYNYKFHENIFSFILNTLYGFLLNFGFIATIPQIFINYKFKFIYQDKRDYNLYLYINLLVISIEDYIDYLPQFKWREPYKLFYLRDEICYFILLIQYYLYRDKKNSIQLKNSNIIDLLIITIHAFGLILIINTHSNSLINSLSI